MTKLNKPLGSLILTGFLFASVGASATNGYFTHGVGAKLKGMAGAGIGSNADMGPIAVANNPALAVFTGDSLELGAALFSPHRSYGASASMANGQGNAFTVGAGEYNSNSNLFAIPYAAKNWVLEDDRAVTLAVYGRGGMNTDWDDGAAFATFDPDGPGPASPSSFPGPFGGGDAGVDLSQLFISVNYAGKVSERLAWGIGPILAVQAFEAEGLGAFAPFTQTFAQSGGTTMPSSLSNNGHDTSIGLGLSLGLWVGLSDSLSAGLSYQTRMEASEFDDYSDLFARGGSFDIPASIRGGLSYLASDSLRLNLDVEHTQYGEIDSVGNPMSLIAGCPSAGLGGTNFANCLGGHDGAGFGWLDMTSYKMGAQWRAASGTDFRLGYSYGEQPIRGKDALFNILAPGIMEQHFTAGLSSKLSNGNEWTIALMYSPEKKVKGRNMFDPTQSIELKMHQFEIEFSLQF